MKMRIKSLLVDFCASALNWINDTICYSDSARPIGPVDHLRWFLEGIFDRLFGLAYEGSRQEIELGIQFAYDDESDDHCTPLQIEIKRRWPEWIDAAPAED